ncbi:hypothetical protein POX_b02864 [Penicillium oxalicum]|uniref:hypothetical protein n=1 Tax=Penicillium oxalicum TaxID=69781 RepID=UPI0020B675E8|nr:hypothetical protein POX_b02864 [Penicillium oxalicum]KAI2792821.1 hypothetical protein POX_b02864 [Penicillium oxalicum]
MPYRIEASPNNRAGCQNKECKDQKIKITKGEIRVGTWVENERFQSWQWRHWGCTTPLILSHIMENVFDKESLEGDENFDLIDGWEDLPEVHQETVRKALTEGHVPDEDWKGDIECNRPGMRGFRLSKKKAAAKKEAEEEEEAKAEGADENKPKGKKVQPVKATKKASRADPKKASNEDHEAKESQEDAEKPVQAKRATRAKKSATDQPADGDASDSPAKAAEKPKRASRTKAPVKAAAEEDMADADEEKPARGRGRPQKSATAVKEAPKPAVAKGRKRKATDDPEPVEKVDKPKRGRKRVADTQEKLDEDEPASDAGSAEQAEIDQSPTEQALSEESAAKDPVPEKPKRGGRRSARA